MDWNAIGAIIEQYPPEEWCVKLARDPDGNWTAMFRRITREVSEDDRYEQITIEDAMGVIDPDLLLAVEGAASTARWLVQEDCVSLYCSHWKG